jgi:hypothetical protein
MITLMAGSGQHAAWQHAVNAYLAHPWLISAGVLVGYLLFDQIVAWVRNGEPNFYDVD